MSSCRGDLARLLICVAMIGASEGYSFIPARGGGLRRCRVSMEDTRSVAAGVDSAKKPYSFVQDEMRPYAMKLHTKDQAPREGEKPAQRPFTQWEATRSSFLQFLADSLVVYETLDEIVASPRLPSLHGLVNTGLERSAALRRDISLLASVDPSLAPVPASGPHGLAYRAKLLQVAEESVPRFVCHYYNQYFAHTAGGVRIGKTLSSKLALDKEGITLDFYDYTGKDLPALLEDTRHRIDAIAANWSPEERQACLEESSECFKYGTALMFYMMGEGGH